MLLQDMQEQVENIGYQARRAATYAGGQTALATMKLASGTGLSALASGSLSTVKSLLGYVGIGLGVALNAYLIESDHAAREEHLLRFYRDEVASMRGVDPRTVTTEDLYAVAAQIPALDETLSSNNRDRYARHASWLGSALITNALMIGYVAGFVTSFVASPFVAGALLALAATVVFHVARQITEPLSEKLFGVQEIGIQERLEGVQHQLSMRRAAPISQEQIFAIMAAASPVLNERIEQHYGHKFQDLSPDIQRHAVAELAPDYGVDALTQDVNAGRIRVQELPFAAVGRASGVEPRDKTNRHVEDIVREHFSDSVAHGRERLGHAASHVSSSVKETAHQVHHTAHEAANRVKTGYQSHGVKGAWQALASRDGARKPQEQSWGDYVQNGAATELKR